MPLWTASMPPCSAAWACSPCTPRTTRRSSSVCWGPPAACAGATTASASWCGPSTPRTRLPPASRTRSSSTRTTCTASTSTSRRPTSSSSSAPSRAARCSAAAAAFGAAPGGSSTSAPATRTTRSTTTPTCSASWPTPSSGPRRVPTSRAPLPTARWRPATGSHDRASARRRRRPRLGRPPPLRAGVVGPGGAGQQPLAAYQSHPDTEIVALAGLEDGPRAKLARKYAIEHTVADWKDLLKVEGLDAVSVCVPTFLHAPIAIGALRRGIHVLSEKPIALNAPEAERMVRAARKADRVLDVAFNHRQRGDIQKLKALIDEGRLGRPYYAKAWWLRRTGIPTIGSWFTRADLAGGGPLVDIGVHLLDYSLFLLGDPEVVAVSASTYDLLATAGFGSNPEASKSGAADGDAPHFDVEDLATVFMRLADGGTLLVEASWAAPRRDGDEFGITLFGTDGGAQLIVDRYAPKGDLQLFGDDHGEPLATSVPVKRGRGHKAVIEQFVDKIRAGDWRRYDGSGAAGLARVVDACYLSAAEQREIRLD